MKSIMLSAPGLICCAGQNRNELYDSCLNGFRGGMVMRPSLAAPLDASSDGAPLDADQNFPVGMISAELPEVNLPPAAYAGRTRIIRIIDKALEQIRPAVEKAASKYGKDKIGVCFGTCDNGSEGSLLAHEALLAHGSFPEDYSLRFQSASFPAEFISGKFGITGPVFTCATACASGASAIIRGAELIRSGFCGAVIAGGADIVSNTVFAGFHSLEAISDSLTNPFSKNRKGINLGEGAAFFLLEPAEQSKEQPIIELLGYGGSADAYHMTAPGTDGAGPVKAMKSAINSAGISPEQIGYINLHGTGTVLNDKAEALALKAVFDKMPPLSSTKPVTGHTLGAAGALEAAICWMALTEKRGLPVHCWDGVTDEEIQGLESSLISIGENRKETPDVCMSNSFAFGGCNVSIILGRR